MKTVLADTNILSYAHNNHTFWQMYQPLLAGCIVIITAQTVAELRYGALSVGWGERRTANLEAMIAQYPVVYPNNAICSGWAEVRVQAACLGCHINQNDAWIAATALALGVPLATHNKKHFDFLATLELI